MALQNDIPSVRKGDWTRLKITIDKLRHIALGAGTSPTFAGLTLTGLTASTLIGANASKALESITVGTGLDYTRPNLTLSHLGIEALTDPGVDKILFWDDTASACKWLGMGNSIAITDVTLDTIQDIRTSANPTFANLTLTGSLIFDTSDYLSYSTGSNYFLFSIGAVAAVRIDSSGPGGGVRTDYITEYAPDHGVIIEGVKLIDNHIRILNGEELRFYDAGSSHYVGFEAPALTANQIWVLPDADGNAGEVMVTDASGNLTWAAGVPGAPAAHTHDGDTLQHDAVNSNAGSFAFTTGGTVTFSHGITMSAGMDLTIAGHIIFNTDNSYIGFTDARLTFNGTAGSATLTGSLSGTSTAAFEGASVTVGKASTTTGTLILHDSGSANTITLTVPNALAGSLSFTLPPTDGDNTDVLQTNGSGVLTWVPPASGAFSSRVYASLSSSQTIEGAWEKVLFDSEVFDGDSEYDNSSNYRFTATNTGYYWVGVALRYSPSISGKAFQAAVKKNGTDYILSSQTHMSSTSPCQTICFGIVYLAATDYIEVETAHNFGVDGTLLGHATRPTYVAIHRLS